MADPLSSSIRRNLSNRDYDKRKKAAVEIQLLVKDLYDKDEHGRISNVIRVLVTDFVGNCQPNHVKGGLIGLAGVVVGLDTEAAYPHLGQIVPPVMGAFSATDSRVRYYALEALFNIAKIARGDLILYFNQIFDGLCKVSSDSIRDVYDVAQMLDRLVQDIVAESDEFSLEEFIPLLKERMSVISPYVRRFLLRWITVLDGVPDSDILSFLPEFLGGIFNMLSDSSLETRQQADSVLSEFLEEIQSTPSVDYSRMAGILIQWAGSSDELTRQSAITWIKEFLKLFGEKLESYFADILGAILPCISDKAEKLRVVSQETNEELHRIKVNPSEGFDVRAMLTVAKSHLSSEWEATRIEALRWISALLDRHRENVLSFLGDFYDSLFQTLSDRSDKVVLLVLDLHACIAQDDGRFHELVVNLVKNFKKDYSLLEKRGVLIISRVCVLFGAERVYREFSLILEKEEELDFASIMIQALNLILLTSSDLSELRELLKQSLSQADAKDFFESLYKPWCHSPVATISLCLLAQAYEHASSVIHSLEEEDINAKFLVQLDKLIRLFESPMFLHLRFQLLEPGRNKSLLKVLSELLMLLPQQSAPFKILNTRLKALPPDLPIGGNSSMKISDDGASDSHITDEMKLDSGGVPREIEFASFHQQLEHMQERHREHVKLVIEQQMNAPPPSEEVKESVEQVAQGAGQVAQGAGQVAQGAGEVAQGAGQVAQGAGQVAQGAGQVAQGSGQVAQGSGQVAQGADSPSSSRRRSRLSK